MTGAFQNETIFEQGQLQTVHSDALVHSDSQEPDEQDQLQTVHSDALVHSDSEESDPESVPDLIEESEHDSDNSESDLGGGQALRKLPEIVS